MNEINKHDRPLDGEFLLPLFGRMRRGSAPVVRWPVALAVLVVGLICGCGKGGSASEQDAGLLPEAVAVRKAFESASPSYRNPIEEALKLVRAGSVNPTAYGEALPQFERLAANPTLSADQKQALDALVQKLKSMGVKSGGPAEIR